MLDMKISSYKQLTVWQKSYNLVKEVYNLTAKLPKSETYGLSSQMQRSAVSIPSNIAEGQLRRNIKEYVQFLSIAQGSAAELDTQLLITQDIYGIDTVEQVKTLEEIQKMLFALSQKLTITYNLKPITSPKS